MAAGSTPEAAIRTARLPPRIFLRMCSLPFLLLAAFILVLLTVCLPHFERVLPHPKSTPRLTAVCSSSPLIPQAVFSLCIRVLLDATTAAFFHSMAQPSSFSTSVIRSRSAGISLPNTSASVPSAVNVMSSMYASILTPGCFACSLSKHSKHTSLTIVVARPHPAATPLDG